MNSKLTPLQEEILKTLIWFIDSDISQFGYITESTLLCFDTQNMSVPDQYQSFIISNKTNHN
jgi:hypothetical protein